LIWCRGGGLAALIVVALVIVGANQAFGAAQGATIGLGASAVIVFLLKGIWEEGSSAFSIPVRYWPIGLAALSGLTFIL
jgi:hypothetical protein